MQKYVIIFVVDFSNEFLDFSTKRLLPGSMFEVDRKNTLEEANQVAQDFNASGGHLLILPYYEVERKHTPPTHQTVQL